MKPCLECGRDYDPADFGAGKNTCSAKCRYAHKKGRQPIMQKGRKYVRKYPRAALPSELPKIRQILTEMGCELSPARPPTAQRAGTWRLTRGFTTYFILHGGLSASFPAHADLCITLGHSPRVKTGYLIFAPICNAGPRIPSNHRDRFLRVPKENRSCGRCPRCFGAKYLRQLHAEWYSRKTTGPPAQNTLDSSTRELSSGEISQGQAFETRSP